ncbi:tetratricopeptide repeat protein [Chitinophaga rhizophila]|uniref:DUF4145 domain-containing protein n=1 Tax=Chitinophaga rhizophila TaxID=2866212 RepID=A0ABS7G6K1_9BACT|nr:hypothetical protein [Chitinophaga rhizophila]MBW8683275.1 hypothetical protein [Chitinophaga rhizophila]
MTISDKLNEIELNYTYWVGTYERKELTTNTVRIVAEGICKAAILKLTNEKTGTQIILGKDVKIPSKRITKGELKLVDLIQVLDDINAPQKKTIKLQLELIRDRANPGSHSANKSADKVTAQDLDICNANIKPIIRWLYEAILEQEIPSTIQNASIGKPTHSLLKSPIEKWQEFEIACKNFDKKTFQYILVSPQTLDEDAYVANALSKLPWRLIIDFDPYTDEHEHGLLYQFNKLKGQGYKKTFTIKDKIEFDPLFSHYWFLANGQHNNVLPTNDYPTWRTQYKKFLSSKLYHAFINGSRLKSRIVTMIDIPPIYADDIIDEISSLDEGNVQFVLCSESETYETIKFKYPNIVTVLGISSIDVANGINNTLNLDTDTSNVGLISIPIIREEKKLYSSITQDHYDYLYSLGIEIVFKGIEKTIPTDDDHRFFKGSTATWRDLSEQRPINRNVLEHIYSKIISWLSENKLEEIQLIHQAGAGGSTLARLIAYKISPDYPTVVIRSYIHKRTVEGLRIIYDQYTKGSLPLLILIESFEVRDSHLLYKDLATAKKNAIIVIVHRGELSKSSNKKFFVKAQLEGTEMNAFESSYILLAPDKKEKIRNIPKEFRYTPKYISPVLYALTAFGKNYNGLANYVSKCLNGVTLEQKKIAGFICLIYHYTQKSVPAELFSALFNVERSKCDMKFLLGSESPLFELLHEEGPDDDYYNIWRPRYAILGEEGMKIILSGGAEYTKNWKTYLAQWLIELIKFVKLSEPYINRDTAEIFDALFIERPYYDNNGPDSEFTRTISDLPNPEDGIAIFEALTNAYPDEAHFHGHFSRYLYSSKIGLKQYNRAIEEAEASLKIYPNNPSLLHTLGMCYREKTENLIYTFEQQGISAEEAEEQIQNLTEQACDVFDNCINEDPYDIYGYESQMRVILKTLDFGYKIYGSTASKEAFITNPQNSWYAERLDKISRLLEEALFVIEQAKTLENKERIQRSAAYVFDCEALLFKTLGKHLTAKSKFEDLIKRTPKGYEYMRPHYRRMFVICSLASKATNQKDFFQAWSEISEYELSQCVQYLEENIFEDPTNTQNIRLWLQAIRHVSSPPSIVNCISKIGRWAQITEQNDTSLLEGYYYLYVLNSINILCDGSFDPSSAQVVTDVLNKMKPYLRNDKFCYEWYGTGNGIQQMVNHRKLGEFSSDFFVRNTHLLKEVTGRIHKINSTQQGIIKLDTGLEAFFVPNVGGFTERHINERIKCYIGFRYDQVQAWSVIELNKHRDESIKKHDYHELKDLIEDSEEIEERNINNLSTAKPIDIKAHIPQIKSPSVIRQVVLPDAKGIATKEAKNGPLNASSYFGKIKLLSGNNGYIQCEELDKDIAFREKHLRKCRMKDLSVDTEVIITVDFLNKVAITDTKGRNYIAATVMLRSKI